MDKNSNQISHQFLSDQFFSFVELYKFYISSVIKLNVFYYAITGAILSYYFSHSSNYFLSFSLLLPIIFSIGLAILFLVATKKVKVMDKCLNETSSFFGSDYYPDALSLKHLLVLFGILHILVALVLLGFFAYKMFTFAFIV